MTDKETKAIVGSKANLKKYQKEEIVIPSPSGFLMYNLEKKPCKNLDSKDMCKIHTKSERPLVCRDYPIFLVKDYFILAPGCEAVDKGMLEEHAIKLEKSGLRRV
jgi:Fe-S-cluster containining protein